MAEVDRRIPVILLTGFLGSGKTSLLRQMLQSPAMAGSAVLINELGEASLDHFLVEHIAEDISVLAAGCLCCRLRGDLARALRELFQRRLARQIAALDRVVIETTGLAEPAAIIHTLQRDFFLAQRFRLEAVISTADACHVRQQLGRHAESLRQILLADRIVLTKCDLVDSAHQQACLAELAALNPGARLFTSGGAGLPPGLFDGNTWNAQQLPAQAGIWLQEFAAATQARASGVFSAPASPHAAQISSHVLRFAQPLDAADFSLSMDNLLATHGEKLLRLKGLLAFAGQPGGRIVQCVQHLRYPDISFADWPDADPTSRLVCITAGLPRAQLASAFAACAPD